MRMDGWSFGAKSWQSSAVAWPPLREQGRRAPPAAAAAVVVVLPRRPGLPEPLQAIAALRARNPGWGLDQAVLLLLLLVTIGTMAVAMVMATAAGVAEMLEGTSTPVDTTMLPAPFGEDLPLVATACALRPVLPLECRMVTLTVHPRPHISRTRLQQLLLLPLPPSHTILTRQCTSQEACPRPLPYRCLRGRRMGTPREALAPDRPRPPVIHLRQEMEVIKRSRLLVECIQCINVIILLPSFF